jgi:hypothetical protein
MDIQTELTAGCKQVEAQLVELLLPTYSMALHPLRDFVQLQIREALDILQMVAAAPQLQEILIAGAEATPPNSFCGQESLSPPRLTADRPPLRAVSRCHRS